MQTYTITIQIINASIEVIAEYGIQGFTTATWLQSRNLGSWVILAFRK
jgi:hypothetical protein